MSSVPAIYCFRCHELRGIRQWHEHRQSFLIELDPCGHVMLRNASVEWFAHRVAAA